MKTLILEKEINFKDLLDFLKEYIHTASVIRLKNTSLNNIPQDILDYMQKDFKKYLDTKCKDFPKEIKESYEKLYKTGINPNYSSKEDIKMLEFNHPEITDYKFKRYSENSIGAIYELIYLKKGEILDEILNQIDNIFDMPFHISELKEDFSDLTLYDQNQKPILIISHEEYAELNLTDIQYEKFKKLKLSKKFNIVENDLADDWEK